MSVLYDTSRWREFRASVLTEDAECALADLAGDCRGVLQLHHIKPLAEGGEPFPGADGLEWLCARHHALVHSWLKKQEPRWKACPHKHRSPEAREQCEARLNRSVAA